MLGGLQPDLQALIIPVSLWIGLAGWPANSVAGHLCRNCICWYRVSTICLYLLELAKTVKNPYTSPYRSISRWCWPVGGLASWPATSVAGHLCRYCICRYQVSTICLYLLELASSLRLANTNQVTTMPALSVNSSSLSLSLSLAQTSQGISNTTKKKQLTVMIY